MKIAIDTNRYRDLREGHLPTISIMESAEQIHVPFVVVAELKIGFGQGKRRAENERILASFLSKPQVAIAFPDKETIEAYSEIFLDLKSRGTPIPPNDLWIAALCIRNNWSLYSRDRHFDLLTRVVKVREP